MLTLHDYFGATNPDHEFTQQREMQPPAVKVDAPNNLNRYRRLIPKFVGRDRAMSDLSEKVAEAGTVAIAEILHEYSDGEIPEMPGGSIAAASRPTGYRADL